MGTYGFVWTSPVQIWPLPDLIGHLAGAGGPERPLLPELHEQLWHEPQDQPSCQILSKYRIMGYQSNRLIKERPNFTIYGHYLYTSVQCAISQIFQHGWIIPHFLAFLVFSLQREHIEKWLIQFWNRLLVRIKCTMCNFPNFSTWSNNYRFLSISGVFSAMGARRKVIDTVLESSTRED